MAEFKLPPISTLAGSSFSNFVKALNSGKVEFRYFPKVLLTGLIILIGTPFRWIEYLIFSSKIKKYKFTEEPIFILGHWRSGTTLLHNLLCQDPRAGFLTTYHSLFTHHLASKWLFKSFMRAAMPKKRPVDNVALSVDYPQEDEFAIGNINPWSYYYFWYFPRNNVQFYEKYVRFHQVPKEVKKKLERRLSASYHKSLVKHSG